MPTDEDLLVHKKAHVQLAQGELSWFVAGFALTVAAAIVTYGRWKGWLYLLILAAGLGITTAAHALEWRRLRRKDPLQIWNETSAPPAAAESAKGAATLNAEAPTVTADTRPWAKMVAHYAQRLRWKVGDRLFDIYRIDAIKSGGFGSVFLCTNVTDHSTRAIKTVQRDPLSDSGVMDDMTREAELWSELEPHPNVVSCDYVIESPTDRRLWLLLDRIDGDPERGATLQEWMRAGGLRSDDVPRIVLGICAGMNHVASAGLIHRDLKPANILMTATGFPKVTDFGLARPRTEVIDGSRVRIAGTPAYMSPEAWNADSTPTAASDVYALGVILFELLTGSQPFAGRDDVSGLAHAHRTIMAQDPRVLNSGASEVFASVANACLSKDPNARPTFAAIEDTIRRAWPFVSSYDADDTGYSPGKSVSRIQNLMAFNRFPQAERELQKAMDRVGKDRPVPLQLHYVKFRLFKATGRLASATESLEYIAAFESSSPGILLQKSEVLWHLGRHGEGLNCLDQALAVEPQHGWCLHAKGVYLLRLGRTDEARVVLQQCGSAPTESGASALIALANLERVSGRPAEALVLLRRVLSINPNNMEALATLAVLEHERGNLLESDETLRQAQAVGSRRAQPRLLEAQLLIARGRLKEAEEILRPFADGDPPNTQACFDFARICAQTGRTPESLQYLQKVLMTQPNSAYEHYVKGSVYGEIFALWDNALQCAKASLALDPSHGGARKLKTEAEKHLDAG